MEETTEQGKIEMWWVTIAILNTDGKPDGSTCWSLEDAKSAAKWFGDEAEIWHYVSDENGTTVEEWKEPKPKYLAVRDTDDYVTVLHASMENFIENGYTGFYEYIPGQDMRLLSDTEVAELQAAQR